MNPPYPIITSWLTPGFTEEEEFNSFLTEDKYTFMCGFICSELTTQNNFPVCPGNSTDTGKINYLIYIFNIYIMTNKFQKEKTRRKKESWIKFGF